MKRVFAASALIAGLGAGTAQGGLITPGPTDASVNWVTPGTGAASAAVESGEGGVRDEIYMYDGSGLTLVGGKLTTSNGGANNTSSNVTSSTGGLLIDLGDTYELNLMQLWGFNRGVGHFGPTRFDFRVATDPSAVQVVGGSLLVNDISKFTTIVDDQAATAPSESAGYLGETYTFDNFDETTITNLGDNDGSVDNLGTGTVTARYVFLDDLQGVGDFGGRTGLFEFQFYGVPEPGSLALLSLGGLCVLRRRRG
ncbi:MAG: PEP-CTERM sorting domain-containing protein [Planctomycetota bacterium]